MPLVWHAGHYRDVAKASQPRFTRININLQRDECNVGKSGNIKAYRRAGCKYGQRIQSSGLDNDNRNPSPGQLEALSYPRRSIRRLYGAHWKSSEAA